MKKILMMSTARIMMPSVFGFASKFLLRCSQFSDCSSYHSPVLLHECCHSLDIKGGETFIDCTLGGGGHSRELLLRGANVIALDQDHDAIYHASNRLSEYITSGKLDIIQGNFRNLESLARTSKLMPINGVNGVLIDLGVSSFQIDESSRGFSFGKEGPLDMRMDQQYSQNSGHTAATIINEGNVEDIADILFHFGEERRSRQIAREIVNSRPIKSTLELATIINRITPWNQRAQTLARCFQAIRIYVNDELNAIRDVLSAIDNIVAPQGRVVVLSYHFLEDRIIKHKFRSSDVWTPINKKVIVASDAEVAINVRARSAKLRAAVKSN